MIIVWFLVLLTVIVFVHELGHYLIARLNGVKVEVFSIGFGQEIYGFTDKMGTRWKLSLIPLGGYVKFFGDANLSSSLPEEQIKNLSDKEKNETFHVKSLKQKAAIVFAGPLANFIFAFILLFLILLIKGTPISVKSTEFKIMLGKRLIMFFISVLKNEKIATAVSSSFVI